MCVCPSLPPAHRAGFGWRFSGVFLYETTNATPPPPPHTQVIYYDDIAYKVTLPVHEHRVPTLLNSVRIRVGANARKTREFVALHANSGVLPPGSTTLVLAPPGHGKSTFLRSLAGRMHRDRHAKGTVLYNGVTYKQALDAGIGINKMLLCTDSGMTMRLTLLLLLFFICCLLLLFLGLFVSFQMTSTCHT